MRAHLQSDSSLVKSLSSKENPRDRPFWKDLVITAMSVVAILSTGATAKQSPLSQIFSKAQMTTHTETTSEVVEVINSMDYNTGYTYSVSGHGVEPQSGTNITPSGTESISVQAPSSSTNSNGISSTWTGLNMGTRPAWKQSTLAVSFPS